jgi:hypothetical protein
LEIILRDCKVVICAISILIKCSFHYFAVSYVDTQEAKSLKLFAYEWCLSSKVMKTCRQTHLDSQSDIWLTE